MSWNANLLLVVSMLFVSWANPLSAQVDDVKDSEPVSEAKDSDQGETTDPPAIEDDLDVLDPLDAFDPLDAINSADPMGKVGSLVDEISRNMKEIERLLEGEDTSQDNQSVQQQTLTKIDELITEVQKLTGT